MPVSREAMAEHDGDRLRAVLSDDMRLVHMTGMVQGREEFIAAMEDGTLDYHSVEIVSVDGESDGERADIRLRTLVDANVFGGPRHTWRLQSDLRMRRTDNGWVITESKASVF